MAEQHHAHQQGWEHKSSHNKLGDFADIPDSAYLLPSMKDDKLRPSPASSISSCAEIADRATLPPFQSQSATNTTSRLPNSRGQKQSKGKATGCFDWTSLNDYHSSAQGSNLNPLESPQPGPTDRKPSFVPFSINTTPPLNRLCPSNDSPKPPFSFLSRPSSPSRRPSDALSSRRASSYAPSRNASETPDPLRRPSGKHADLLEAQRHLSLRPDVDPVFGLGSVATAEATPVDARRESFPWAFDEEILTPAEAAGDVDEKEGGRKDSRNELASFPARSRQGSKGGGDGERRGSGRCPVGVRRAQELLGDSVPPLPVVGSDRKMVRGARSVDDMRRMSVPEKHEIEAGEEDDDLGNLDEVERGRQHSASVDVPRTKTKVKRNRANSILVTREVKLETSASAPVSVIGSRAGSFDWRGGGAER
ncbi:Hypothetical protein D9617_2g052350 [Elsinoe fawcettii]|nr:Hypothetical protein D9617_2g052350 [Elsinoe fawcettii]